MLPCLCWMAAYRLTVALGWGGASPPCPPNGFHDIAVQFIGRSESAPITPLGHERPPLGAFWRAPEHGRQAPTCCCWHAYHSTPSLGFWIPTRIWIPTSKRLPSALTFPGHALASGLQVRMQSEGKLPPGTPRRYPSAFKAYGIIRR
jgi:hypothetical protein